MAVSANDVYRTVLLILNKEQRGYMTPEEFNNIATQVQREIFEKYFEDLNQELRQPGTEYDYADRLENTDGKLEIFKKDAALVFGGGSWALPTDFYRLGSVTFTNTNSWPIEIERLNRTEFTLVSRSKLAKPSFEYPVYLFEDNKIITYPDLSNYTVNLQYVKKPADVVWGYTIGGVGQFVNAPGSTVDFELHNSERTEIILRILVYAGVVIRDPQIVQAAAGQLQADLQNEKS